MIDFHVHQPAAAAYGPAEYLGAMDELGVDVSVVFTYEGLLRPSAAANDSLAAWVAPAPARLVAFATVDPRDPGASAEIERCVREHAMRGVKLHPWLQGFSAHDPGLSGPGSRGYGYSPARGIEKARSAATWSPTASVRSVR